MKRRLPTKKILVATLGVGAVSYVVACMTGPELSNGSSGNLMAPEPDAGSDAISSSGNLMAPQDAMPPKDAMPPIDAAHDAGNDAISSSGNLMAPTDASSDASDGGKPADGGGDAGDGG